MHVGKLLRLQAHTCRARVSRDPFCFCFFASGCRSAENTSPTVYNRSHVKEFNDRLLTHCSALLLLHTLKQRHIFRGTFPDVSCHYVQISGPGRNSKTRSVVGNWSLMMSSSNLSRCLARGGIKSSFIKSYNAVHKGFNLRSSFLG